MYIQSTVCQQGLEELCRCTCHKGSLRSVFWRIKNGCFCTRSASQTPHAVFGCACQTIIGTQPTAGSQNAPRCDPPCDRLIKDSIVSGVIVKIDPGSKQTGIAVVRPDDNGIQHAQSYLCLEHRGAQIHKKMGQRASYRRRRRSANRSSRAARFNNRKRRQEWLPPSLEHRVATTQSWVQRLKKIAPIQEIHMELVKFDTQKLQNPEIIGIEYQRGELFG